MGTFIESWIGRVLFSMISFIAFLGNISVIWIFIRKRKLYTKKPFDVFIVNLAIADLATAVFLIFSRFLYLPTMPDSQPEAFFLCNLLWGGYILFGLGYVSVYTCLLLTIERWLAIFKPHLYRRLKTKHTIFSIIIVWFWAFFISSTVFISINENFQKRKCEWIEPKVGSSILPVFEVSFTCIVPFSIIICLYTQILYKIGRMPLILKGSGEGLKKRLTVIALVASIALIIGWLPTQINYMLRYFGVTNLQGTEQYIFIIMALGNSCINPILYGIYSSRFRKEYLSLIFGIFSKTSCQRVACNSTGPALEEGQFTS